MMLWLVETDAEEGLTATEDSVTGVTPEGEITERSLEFWSLT